MARSGRRPGASGARQSILAAAQRQFADRGYDATSMRAIAADARVDAALVHHYFASKEELFVEATRLPFRPADVVAAVRGGDPALAGERVVRLFLDIWEGPDSQEAIRALMRSSLSQERAATLMRELVGDDLVAAVATAIDSPEAGLRASVITAQLVGAGFLRYLLRVEPLAGATDDQVVALLAPTIQRYLDG